MASVEPTRDFDSRSIKKEDKKKIVLSYSLPGFKPSNGSHSCNACVTSDNELIVWACMESRNYKDVILNIDISEVSAKGSDNTVKVRITKPDPDYSIQSKLSM